MPFELTVKDKDKDKSLTITTGSYLDTVNGWEFWLERQDGEGQSISEKNLYDVLDKFFEENM